MSALPASLTGERELLLAFLAHQRHLVRVQAHGLADTEAAATPTRSTLSIGGLVRHLAQTERNWTTMMLQRPRPQLQEAFAAYAAAFRFGPGDSLDAALRDYEAAARETDEAVAGLALDDPVPIPKDMPWFPKDADAWTVRWVVLHLIEETARHLGHADIVRESVDGATAIPLLAAVEGWEETPWVTPWRRAEETAATA